MYEGYAWLTNARPPVRTAERLLLLVGMAGFLAVGLAIPHGFGPEHADSGPPWGSATCIVVLVHASLYYRVNRNIMRIAPVQHPLGPAGDHCGLLPGGRQRSRSTRCGPPPWPCSSARR